MSLYDLEIIDLDVNIRDGKVVSAKCSGNKVRGFEKAFTGKDAKTLYEVLPRVLATCSQSHLYVYVKPHTQTSITELLMFLEIIDSHMKHPYAYWFPHIIKDEKYSFPSGEKFRKVSLVSRKIKEIMEKIGGKWPHVDYLRGEKIVKITKGELRDITSFMESELLGMSIEDFLNVKMLEELSGDLKLMVEKSIDSLNWNFGLRNYLVVGFPFKNTEFDCNYIKDEGLEVSYKGKKVEVGPLAQALTFDKLVKSYFNKYGPSPLLREISRIKVAVKLISEINDLDINSERFSISDGNYVSFAESIRGSLIHQYEISNGKISNYRIIQPTTFIASPSGALESAVIGLPIKSAKDPVELALTVSSLDTCFVTRVRVFENEKLVTTKRIGGFC
ncbi:nickel-dependent hydrogenase large subunit [Saccharolobus shibatae]|uniref:Hydrogenase n=1 Tax=Saccharolobus shibatae TaxID=2286 RepID=A0A8F5H0F0_9CREN|nr:nickel-dependent hydrogenase large subunit [Saccharolobus shibatae]QXJ35537.1 hypothetical protein J5U22_02084 [Saccharolobus shibatae]